MADDSVYADLLDSLSPLTKAGIDPDDARMDRAGTMDKLLGPAEPAPWYEAENDVPPRPGSSPNGNALPPGLNSRVQAPAAEPAAAPVPASVTPSGDAADPATLARNNAATIGRMQSDYNKASDDVQAERSQPDLDQVTKNLEQQRQNQAQPINAYDPKTGKLLDEYKPSFGQRLMRGVEGFAGRGIVGAIDPAAGGATPYGAPNRQYTNDVQQQTGRVASLDQQLKQAKDNYTEKSKRLQQVAKDSAALATTGKDVTGASIAQQDQPNKDKDAAARAQEAANNSPDAKATVAKNAYDTLNKKADDLKLKGQQRTLFLANGKLPDPRQATGDEIARSQATAAWHRDNPGKQPTLDDIRSINAAVGGSEIKNTGKGGSGKPIPPALQNKMLDEKKAAMDTATSLYRAGTMKDGFTKYTAEDWQNDMQAAQDKFESAIEAEGGTTDHMTIAPDGQWTASSGGKKEAAAPAAASGGEGPRDGEVAVLDKDGNPGFIPAGQLQKALSKGYKLPPKGK